MKQKARKPGLLLAIALMVTSLLPAGAASAEAGIEIGQYLQMGNYYGEPILWRCVDIDENGPLMLADRILCLKAFDAPGTDTRGSHGRGYSSGDYRKLLFGSNYWGDSTLRCWLNSRAGAGQVVFSCGNPPDKAHVSDGDNAYDQEAGFLTNFTDSELAAMKTVSHRVLLDRYEYNDMSPYGETYHKRDFDIATCVQNFDKAYAEVVTDTMFLPDVKQINKVWQNLGNYYIGYPTASCVKRSEYQTSSLSTTSRWWSWLGSPYAYSYSYSSYCVRNVDSDGTVTDDYAYSSYGGVRPAFYLHLTSSRFVSGDGSDTDPYTIATERGVSWTEKYPGRGALKILTEKSISACVITLKYPSALQIAVNNGFGFAYVEAEEPVEDNGFQTMTVTCQYSDDQPTKPVSSVVPFGITVTDQTAPGDHEISIESVICYDENYEEFTIEDTESMTAFLPVSKITVSGQSDCIGSAQYTASVLPEHAKDKSVTWSVSNPSLATISQDGILTAIGDGWVSVYATAKDGSGVVVRKSVAVHTLKKAKSITVSGNDTVSGVATYTASVSPDDTDNKAVTWSVSDPSLAAIDQTGKVTALQPGTVTVSATAQDGSGVVGSKSVTLKPWATIDTLTADVGIWDKELTIMDFSRTLYVPKGTAQIKLSATFTGGNLKYNGTSLMLNKSTKTIPLTGQETTFTLTRGSVTDHIDSTYTIRVVVMEDALDSTTTLVTGSWQDKPMATTYVRLGLPIPETAPCGIRLWEDENEQDALTLPALGAIRDCFAVRVFGDAFAPGQTYHFQPYIGEFTGTEKSATIE